MGKFGEAIIVILTSVIGVAILAVIVSNSSNTSGVIQAASSGFSGILGTALSPVTGGSSSLGGLFGNSNSILNSNSGNLF